mgnify:FL=1
MEMVRLIYVSRMTETCDMKAIQEILAVSRKKNAAEDITGILVYDPTFFLQCLEGPKTAVNALYRTIMRDERHTNVTILEYANIQERRFGNWAMGFLSQSEIDKNTLAAYMKSGRFDPYVLRGEQALSFLIKIVAQEQERLAAQKK